MKLGKALFAIRSYTPIPLLTLIIVFAHPSPLSLGLGGAVSVFGEIVRIWAVGHAGSITRATDIGSGLKLVTSGPYSYVRNPIYLGNFLISLGVCIASLATWVLPIFLLGFAVQYHSIIRSEEEYLKKRFGLLYENYLVKVPKFIPNFRPYQNRSEHKFSIAQALKGEKRTLLAIALSFLAIIIRSWR